MIRINMNTLRILGIGESNDLAAMYLSLAQHGNEVRVFIAEPDFHGVFARLPELTLVWRQRTGLDTDCWQRRSSVT